MRIPSPEEIESQRTERNGFTKETLASWGIPWPAPKGWMQDLHEKYACLQADKVSRDKPISAFSHDELIELTPEEMAPYADLCRCRKELQKAISDNDNDLIRYVERVRAERSGNSVRANMIEFLERNRQAPRA